MSASRQALLKSANTDWDFWRNLTWNLILKAGIVARGDEPDFSTYVITNQC